MLYTIGLIIHVIISVALVLVILSQTSKGGLDANLGGAAMNVFGGSGASKFLRKWTQILSAVFAVSCIFLALQVKSLDRATTPKALAKPFTSQTGKTAPAQSQPAQNPGQK